VFVPWIPQHIYFITDIVASFYTQFVEATRETGSLLSLYDFIMMDIKSNERQNEREEDH
jgi:16S rRNA C1402 (ribose-2'-O) methylase RsmI